MLLTLVSWSRWTLPYLTSLEKCKKYCFEANNYQFAGVYNGEDCYCTSQGQEPQIKPRTECNKKCPGNPHQKCGGLERINAISMEGTNFENESTILKNLVLMQRNERG